MGRIVGAAAVRPFFFGGGAGSPSTTMIPGTKPTSIPSGVVIHPAVWPQQTLAKNWGYAPFLRGDLSPSNTMWLDRGLPSYPVSS